MSDGATNEFEDDLPLVGYLATVSAILRHEGREAWAENISKSASKINKMQKEIESLRRQLEPLTTFASAEAVAHLRAENEKLRSDVRTAVFADSAELKDVKRYNEELRGLLREAWVKMEANNLWSNLRARVAAALKETDDV